ncbi:MAG TPA: phenylalanine 4-monooxygenase [Actinocrinis sp.]|uniref:phenylalanine 4-monooxygenase n=1 Tax=Actinocrinis sp. TaxID=1920516 RepID=UPI002DDDAEC1|nr:phenylalanine 4-monooxygenase [Actinocrinis sp.]HEV2344231.1 phenylalanine 4-monooxygenase [Actinocrinis sp.]
MPEKATLYNSPVIRDGDGTVRVLFAGEHPGFHDPGYREHRAMIARAALEHTPGTAPAHVEYTEQEHDIWRLVSAELAVQHEQHACAQYLDAVASLKLPADRIPQLAEVSAALEQLTGFRFAPAAGLEEARTFYGALAQRRFHATQYIRHRSTPRFSTEPDMIHEIVGHGAALASARWADVYELVGRTIERLASPDAVELVSRVFWFTLECGLVRERGEVKIFGASLLSSCGEMDQFSQVAIRALDVPAMAGQGYRADTYQQVLFCADSFGHMEDFLMGFLDSVDDASPQAMVPAGIRSA